MSDTPRTDAVQDELINEDTYTLWLEMSQTARQLERELNAANERIKRLEEAGDKMAKYIKVFDPQENYFSTSYWKQANEPKP